ncbi:lipopolysaccharide transport periplasmic protein LptA [Psychromonas ossibalaenae]|uniref:lipopolysaccharide transport periplasmic protein LptA n=1 Tax=Psychromonas ossibalaenae TaxID=444922 RepID=UPI0003784EFB|nr:lipopolysaccharide transport periplasmic protein LptA [Psychromonas ossibalaenae]
MKKNNLSIIFSIFFFSCSSFALQSDFDQPINVSSVSQHAKMKSNTVVFQKDVLLTQGTIKITGDKLTVIRGTKPNHEVMTAEGKVATFYQTQDDGKPFDAEADSIRYEVAKGKITLTGNAQVKQLDSQINGAKIIYFLETEELIVNTDQSKGERVKTVFLPAQFEKNKTKQPAAEQSEKSSENAPSDQVETNTENMSSHKSEINTENTVSEKTDKSAVDTENNTTEKEE